MSIAIRLLNQVKDITGTDSATAERFEICQSTISKIRHGDCPMRAYHAARMSEMLEKHWFVGLMQTLIERSENAEEATYWRQRFTELQSRYKVRGKDNSKCEVPKASDQMRAVNRGDLAMVTMIKTIGLTAAKARTPRSSWYKLIRRLKAHGIDPKTVGKAEPRESDSSHFATKVQCYLADFSKTDSKGPIAGKAATGPALEPEDIRNELELVPETHESANEARSEMGAGVDHCARGHGPVSCAGDEAIRGTASLHPADLPPAARDGRMRL